MQAPQNYVHSFCDLLLIYLPTDPPEKESLSQNKDHLSSDWELLYFYNLMRPSYPYNGNAYAGEMTDIFISK